jgi:hypothetical protein
MAISSLRSSISLVVSLSTTRLTTCRTSHLPGVANDVDVRRNVDAPIGFAASGVGGSDALAR